jgi:hypothetical protein
MAATGGAGASVFSGADYQARIGGYLLVTSMCGVESAVSNDRKVASVGFETTESVDDINVRLVDGTVMYIQAKTKIDFSTSSGGDLRSVLEQFGRQHHSRPNASDCYYLITSGRSSRKVTYDMRAALEAFRLGEERYLRRDQPQALVQIIDELLSVLRDIQAAPDRALNDAAAREILRKSFVLTMDIESGDAVEQGLLLVLQSRHFVTPTAVWGKIVSDCVAHGKARRTVDIAATTALYERFRVQAGELPEQASADLMKVDLGNLEFSVGREVLLCRLPVDGGNSPGVVIMELYRFDGDCNERVEFDGNKCRLSNGMEVFLLRRAATYEGLTR